jgi:hypothetical protein
MRRSKLRNVHPGEVLLEEFLKPLGLTQYQGGGLILWLGGGLGLIGSLLLVGGLPTPADWRILTAIVPAPAWLKQFIQRAVYLLRCYQSFLRQSFKRLNLFGTGR